MKAITLTQFGAPDVLTLTERPKPTPKQNELLIRVRATTVGIGDLWARRFNSISPADFSMAYPLWLAAKMTFGWNRPRISILGAELAGEVEALGQAVTNFRPGDPVFAYRGQALGAYAEYVCIPATGLVAPKPANLTFDEAATVPYGALTALSLLRRADIRPGQRVLIVGASGKIGSFALQLAKHQGAHVTGVCATARVPTVRALGADAVIDYTRETFTGNGQRYDLIFDVARHTSFTVCRTSLTAEGIYLLASFKTPQLWQMWQTSRRPGQRVICALSSETCADLLHVKDLVEAGALKTVVDRRFPLAQAAAAHRYMESGQRTGSVVITVN
jgi:NADPH:quinone reductase-like Zn-dependent oxidoreductase